MKLKLLTLLCLSLGQASVFAQFDFPSLSPKGNIVQTVGNTKIEVEYERPSARNRKIFGELVPWNKVWRTGAGHCTKISFDKSVKVGGQPVSAGTYSLFTIPGKERWVVIINSDTTLYGSYDYNAKKDVARFVVKPVKPERFFETLTIDIDLVPNNAKMYISWVNTQIGFEIETYTDENVLKFIEEQLITGKSKEVDDFGMAAEYLQMSNDNFDLALDLAQKMIDMGGNEGWGRNIKLSVYEKLHLYDKALEQAKWLLEKNKKTAYEKEANRMLFIRYHENQVKRIEAKMERAEE